jgi:hypothetical protein
MRLLFPAAAARGCLDFRYYRNNNNNNPLELHDLRPPTELEHHPA